MQEQPVNQPASPEPSQEGTSPMPDLPNIGGGQSGLTQPTTQPEVTKSASSEPDKGTPTPPPAGSTPLIKPKKPGLSRNAKIILIVVGVLIILGLVVQFAIQAFFGGRSLFGSKLLSPEKKVEKAIEENSGEKVDVEIKEEKGGGYFRVANEEPGGGLEIEKKEIPDNFPSDIPAYEPSDVLASFVSETASLVTLGTDSNIASVSEYYKSEMISNGWELISETDLGEAVSLSYKKGERESAIMIGATSEGEYKTTITISYSNFQPDGFTN